MNTTTALLDRMAVAGVVDPQELPTLVRAERQSRARRLRAMRRSMAPDPTLRTPRRERGSRSYARRLAVLEDLGLR